MGMSHRKGELREIGAHRYTLAICVCLFSPIFLIIYTLLMPNNQDVELVVALILYLLFTILFEKRYSSNRMSKISNKYKDYWLNKNIGNIFFLIITFILSVIYAVCFAVFFHSVTEKYHLNGCLCHLINLNI